MEQGFNKSHGIVRLHEIARKLGLALRTTVVSVDMIDSEALEFEVPGGAFRLIAKSNPVDGAYFDLQKVEPANVPGEFDFVELDAYQTMRDRELITVRVGPCPMTTQWSTDLKGKVAVVNGRRHIVTGVEWFGIQRGPRRGETIGLITIPAPSTMTKDAPHE